ncbi:alpha/beta fold hydrolase [Paenibacillus puerhi]|uniref:alpha/beta fold hydrolase n=1 Tax=Paenibacillus puerhi TaxID=2692622 RepID=UPI001358BF67|nr:alpha/beta hydrolase [Paenibacillus puerhi]
MPETSELFKSKQLEQKYMDAYAKTLSLWPVPYESVYVETSYGTTHVLVSGPTDGSPVMLLNGFGFSATMWYPNVQALATNHRVYAVDVIGEFNRSAAKKHFTAKADYVNWLVELLDRLGIEQADFIGHSNGGWHVLNFSMQAPHRVRKIVLLAPAASFAPFTKQFGIRLLAANVLKFRPVIIDFCAKWFIGKENRGNVSDHLIEQFYHGIKGFGWKHKVLIPSVYRNEELQSIAKPALLIIGEKEVIYDYKRALARAKQLIPHIQTRSISGVGHGTNIEKPEYVNQEMVDFLKSK